MFIIFYCNIVLTSKVSLEFCRFHTFHAHQTFSKVMQVIQRFCSTTPWRRGEPSRLFLSGSNQFFFCFWGTASQDFESENFFGLFFDRTWIFCRLIACCQWRAEFIADGFSTDFQLGHMTVLSKKYNEKIIQLKPLKIVTILIHTVGIWNPTIWTPETFESGLCKDRISNGLIFEGLGFSYGYMY